MQQTTLLAALCGTTTAAGQTPPATGPDVVVVAHRAAEKKRETKEFVRNVSASPIDGQFARWHTPLCPAVSGVSPNIADRVSSRILAVARAAGAPVAKPGCKANALVVFTPDAHSTLGTMERQQPLMLQNLPFAEVQVLRASRAPVIWWNGTLTEGADGNPLQSTPSVAIGMIGSSGPSLPVNDHTKWGDSYRSSLISSSIRVAIESAVVLIDVQRSTGRRLDAITDYAAFTILARVRPNTPQTTAPTILKLFATEQADSPVALTDPDRAYLAALYSVAPDRTATIQSARIISAINGR